jgi:TldD protein
MTFLTRRHFLRSSSLAAAAAALPLWTSDGEVVRHAVAPQTGSPELAELTDAALAAAKSAGATYADVHVRVMQREQLGAALGLELLRNPTYELSVGFGVRALVNGYWGYAGIDGPMTAELVTQMGRDATLQARAAATGKPRHVELAPTPPVRGTWTTPIEIDPFTISYEEKNDVLTGITDYVGRLRDVSLGIMMRPRETANRGTLGITFTKEERTFASSDGSFTTQTTYDTTADLQIGVVTDWMSERGFTRSTGLFSIAGAGWEYIRSAPFRTLAPRMIDEALHARRAKPVDVGRYDIVFDAQAMAGMVERTIGPATALDRAMGDLANDGTSYLNDPLGMLGTYRTGSSLLTVTANRSMPGGCATVAWDDEGVVPVETTLVRNGILTDYQTTRESASWLAPYYTSAKRTVRSNGCACGLGTLPVRQRSPNLVMAPGRDALSFEELVKDTPSGLAVIGGFGRSDYQSLNGTGTGEMVVEIKNGKLGQRIDGATYNYRAPEFWRNLVAVGGAESAVACGFERMIPERVAHTIVAVPGKVTGVAVVNALRRA